MPVCRSSVRRPMGLSPPPASRMMSPAKGKFGRLLLCVQGSLDLASPGRSEKGGYDELEQMLCCTVVRLGADYGGGVRATGAVQRDRRHHGSLAHRLEGCGSEQEALPRDGR